MLAAQARVSSGPAADVYLLTETRAQGAKPQAAGEVSADPQCHVHELPLWNGGVQVCQAVLEVPVNFSSELQQLLR